MIGPYSKGVEGVRSIDIEKEEQEEKEEIEREEERKGKPIVWSYSKGMKSE